MPSQWWLPFPAVPGEVRPEHIHAVVSRWFDGLDLRDTIDDGPVPGGHRDQAKVFSLSPPGEQPDGTGVQLGLLTDRAADRLLETIGDGTSVALGRPGRQWPVHLARPVLLQHTGWDELARPTGASRWELTFETPMTVRTGDRFSPLPNVGVILQGLARQWNAWAPVPIELDAETVRAVWARDLDLTSHVLSLAGSTVCGSTGTLTLACDDRQAARTVAPLLALAPFAGVGAMRTKGLGVTSVRPLSGR